MWQRQDNTTGRTQPNNGNRRRAGVPHRLWLAGARSRTVHESQFDNRDVVETRNHYNAGLNKCFVETRTVSLAFGNRSESKILTDAFEGKDYGSYIFVSKPNEADWQVTPTECKVTLPSGEETICHSSDEFDALVKQYIQ